MGKWTNMKKYDFIIVLCASRINNGKFDDLEEKNGMYLGGDDRMKAALDLNDQTNKFIVVGGGMEKEINERWLKTDDMYEYLLNNSVDSSKIIRVASEPDTTGNMSAIYKCLREVVNNKRVGILTNYYHIPRALRFAEDIFVEENVRFIPIIAESSVNTFPFKYWPQLIVRTQNEVKGLTDWNKGIYNHQDKPKQEWLGEINKKDLKKIK